MSDKKDDQLYRPAQHPFTAAVQIALVEHRNQFFEIMKTEPILCFEVKNKDRIRIDAYLNGRVEPVAAFRLNMLPGCCGVAVFNGALVAPEFRRKGLGRLFLRIRERAAILAGYSFAMATTVSTNEAENALLKSEGWGCGAGFNNARTNNDVRVWTKVLERREVDIVGVDGAVVGGKLASSDYGSRYQASQTNPNTWRVGLDNGNTLGYIHTFDGRFDWYHDDSCGYGRDKASFIIALDELKTYDKRVNA